MATLTSITFTCGHAEDRDLSNKKPFERPGFIKWLEGKPCRNCDPAEKRRKEKFVAGKRAEEAAAAEAVEKRFGMDPLQGPPAILGWGTRVRAQLIEAAYNELGLDEADFATQIAEPASEVSAAGWWLDNREIELDQLPTALTEALADPDAAPADANENPF